MLFREQSGSQTTVTRRVIGLFVLRLCRWLGGAVFFIGMSALVHAQCVYVRSDPVNGTINVPINHPISVFYQSEHVTDRCAPLFLYQKIDYPGAAPISIDTKVLLNDQWHRSGSHLFYGRIVFEPRDGALQPHTTYLLRVHQMTIARFMTHVDQNMRRGRLIDTAPLVFHALPWRGEIHLNMKDLSRSDQVWLGLDWPFVGPQQRAIFLKDAQLFFPHFFHRSYHYPVSHMRLHFLSVLPSGTLSDQYATVFMPEETKEAVLPESLPLWVLFPSSFETVPAGFYEWLGAQVATQGRVLMIFDHQKPSLYVSSMGFSAVYHDAYQALLHVLSDQHRKLCQRPIFFGGGDGALNAFWSLYQTEMLYIMHVPTQVYLYAGLFDVFRTMRFYFSESLLFGHFQNPSNLMNFSVMHRLLSRYLLSFSEYWGFDFSVTDVFSDNGFPRKSFLYQFLSEDNALTRELILASPIGNEQPWRESDIRFSVYDSGQDHIIPSDNTRVFFMNFLSKPYHFHSMRYVSCFDERMHVLYHLGVLPYHDLCALFVWNDVLAI